MFKRTTARRTCLPVDPLHRAIQPVATRLRLRWQPWRSPKQRSSTDKRWRHLPPKIRRTFTLLPHRW